VFKENQPMFGKIRETFHPTPIRKRIMEALFKLKMQLARLDRTAQKMQQRDATLHSKCVTAIQQKNTQLASMYANECAEIRKMAKVVLQSQLALEQVALRLDTVMQYGDVAHAMMPVASVVRTIKTQLEGVLPEVSMELASVNESLEYLVMQVGEATDQSFDTSITSEGAQKILSEANVVAEQKMRERFPDLPQIAAQEARVQ
jgi:division protein CdvB (Snf7/Vps24/ESCRT-III family)